MGRVKIIGQNLQFLGVNNAIASTLRVGPTVAAFSARRADGADTAPLPKHGIGDFWQTQGSGKSFSMAFFAQKVLRKVAGSWTFVVVTNRVEPDDQMAMPRAGRTCGSCCAGNGEMPPPHRAPRQRNVCT